MNKLKHSIKSNSRDFSALLSFISFMSILLASKDKLNVFIYDFLRLLPFIAGLGSVALVFLIVFSKKYIKVSEKTFLKIEFVSIIMIFLILIIFVFSQNVVENIFISEAIDLLEEDITQYDGPIGNILEFMKDQEGKAGLLNPWNFHEMGKYFKSITFLMSNLFVAMINIPLTGIIMIFILRMRFLLDINSDTKELDDSDETLIDRIDD